MSGWDQKVILVTGGSAGLGLEIARSFARRGARLVLVARGGPQLERARATFDEAGTRVTTISADVTRPEAVQQLFQRIESDWGRLDVLINAAGKSDRGRIEDTPLEKFTAIWTLNFLGAVCCIQAGLPLLTKSRGSIVNIGSLAAKIAAPYLGAYPASKFPLAALSQQLRLELADRGVHVLLVCPGPIARDDAGRRYAEHTPGLPPAALRPGGGARLSLIAPARLADQIVRSCELRKPELVVPRKARVLCALAQLWPSLGDRLLKKMTA